jgi:hypothetical protein
MEFDSEFIGGSEFLIKKELTVAREQPQPHECVCLIIKGPPVDPEAMKAIELAAEKSGIPIELAKGMFDNRDKCHRMVDSPDQAFCDPCESAQHHLSSQQAGGARNIHKKGKDA